MVTPFTPTATADKFEMQVSTNYLGHLLLNRLLMPTLKAAAPVQLALSCIGHRHSDVEINALNFERCINDKWNAYGQAKTANALHPSGPRTKLQNTCPGRSASDEVD